MPQPSESSLDRLLAAWRNDPAVGANIAAWRTLPARPAQYAPFPPDLDPALRRGLEARGIRALYTHQALAWDEVSEGHHVVVVTATASGKTLCYNLPVLQRLMRDPQARALYLFPTKALSQDQVAGLRELTVEMQRGHFDAPRPVLGTRHALSVATYDGDTRTDARPSIRANARIVISNPDMLHTGILPHHTLWADFFAHLQFVVVDEMHTYRGVFGSHVANVIRRLKRAAAFYGGSAQFILTSATIANPLQLAEALVEEPVSLVSPEFDGSPRGEKHFLLYNPPVVNRDLGLRRSALLESVRLAQDVLERDIQTIVFARTRRTVELILKYLQPSPGSLPAPLSPVKEGSTQNAVRGYRGGYLPTQRREIEQGLRSGAVRGVVATNALELGIDIGGMGAAVLAGYPGSVAATWQQAGRAGRTSAGSLAVLVASADPLDQFLAQHPDYFFSRPVERGLVNPDNLLILLQHIRCATFELPFREGEGFGRVPAEKVEEFLHFLREAGILHQSAGRYYWMADQYPADTVSLRSASPDTVALQVDAGQDHSVIGQVDRGSAAWMVHPQAVYLHEAQSYVVDSLDLEQGLAHLRAVETDYYTEPRRETTVRLLTQLAEAPARGATKQHGEIAVTTQIVGYRKVKWYTHQVLGLGDLALPPSELHTTAYWLTLAPETVDHLRDLGLWTNDPNNYGPNWDVQRARARARDGYRCTVCDLPEQGQAHQVHHKIPFRAFSSWREANELHNLVTVCPACHRRVEANVRIRSGLAGLSFVLGHLAPLFLMCDTHDIGVHSDPQSPLADGRPTVVIYDEVPAGIGFSEQLYDLHDELLARALERVRDCPCQDGCPSCVGPGGENGLSGKREARALLEMLAA